jgi:hypothetical protein
MVTILSVILVFLAPPCKDPIRHKPSMFEGF